MSATTITRKGLVNTRSFALSMYRTILRSHRSYLPPQMRALGDEYVRNEWKLHKEAKREHLPDFFAAWLKYLQQLHDGKHDFAGADMRGDEVDLLTEEAIEQLAQLKREIFAGEAAEVLAGGSAKPPPPPE